MRLYLHEKHVIVRLLIDICQNEAFTVSGQIHAGPLRFHSEVIISHNVAQRGNKHAGLV